MRLVVIFGPAAVGKMAVGFELQRLTGLRLFHNHLAVDLALRFFPFGTPQFSRLVSALRTRVFEEGASVCYVELAAMQEERLRRNVTPLRLAENHPKRDVSTELQR